MEVVAEPLANERSTAAIWALLPVFEVGKMGLCGEVGDRQGSLRQMLVEVEVCDDWK